MPTNEGESYIMEEFRNLKKEVEDSLKNIDFYNFAELLSKLTDKLDNNDQHLQTVRLFLFGNYKQYLRNQTRYIELDEKMTKKLKYITIMNMWLSEMSKMQVEVIDCDFLAKMLVMELGDDFNRFITDFLREGPLHATLSEDKKQLKIFGLINRAEIKLRIENSIKKPKFYGFKDMIFQPSINLLHQGDQHLETLKLFAYLDFGEYANNKRNYIELDDEMMKKFKFTRIVKMAHIQTCIQYNTLFDEFSIDNEDALKNLIEDFLKNGRPPGTVWEHKEKRLKLVRIRRRFTCKLPSKVEVLGLVFSVVILVILLVIMLNQFHDKHLQVAQYFWPGIFALIIVAWIVYFLCKCFCQNELCCCS